MFRLSSMTALFAAGAYAGCPFGFDKDVPPTGVPEHNPYTNARIAPKGYLEAVAKIDFNAVKEDLKALFVDSQEFWPADYDHYGPLIIRLAWHSAGSYRVRDGRGGADGGRMRFDPERSWADNTNLDKARTLLEPLKQKYGIGLSWGDLFVLAGDAAIESMGGPTVGFCAGRIDDASGFWSDRLGPTPLQEDVEPCEEGNRCEHQAAVEVGLIYVNPEGPMIDGERKVDPVLSGIDVRETFRRMGMNDTETVALVGGGHAFGKHHGACPLGPGASPMEDPANPWPGNCGTGTGVDTFTSGFEGPWTSNPTKWDNEYFKNLFEYEWEKVRSPGGPYQWHATNEERKMAPQVNLDGSTVEIVMNTADLSLRYDPEYKEISKKFKLSQDYLDVQFGEAWYKLMTRDMGPVTRCLGNLVPEPRPFQNPLPAAPSTLGDFKRAKARISNMITNLLASDSMDIRMIVPGLVKLAWKCASTHRVTDWTGGCNGARILREPQKSWPTNAGLEKAMLKLEWIQESFPDISHADLIVLAGNAALEHYGAPTLPFCGGRTDATRDGAGGAMPPLLNGAADNTLDNLRESALLLGVSPREWTALQGFHAVSMGKMMFSEYFKMLVNNRWEEFRVNGNGVQTFKAISDKMMMITRPEYLLTLEPEFRAAAQDFAADEDLFLQEFAAAWTKVMNADRYDGPTKNLCAPYKKVQEPIMPAPKCEMRRRRKPCEKTPGCVWKGKCMREQGATRRLSVVERLSKTLGL